MTKGRMNEAAIKTTHSFEITDDLVLRKMQQDLRQAITRNKNRVARGGKDRGQQWLRRKQAQCMIIGHVENPFGGIVGVCRYCGAVKE